MNKSTLYHFPGACSQVSLFALEASASIYDVRLVNLAANEQASTSYLGISSLGKVPVLEIDGVMLSENSAILTFIAASCPEAGLFPPDVSPLHAARRQAGLSFCGGTLHPIVRGIANPARLTDGDPEPVRHRATALANKSFAYADRHLHENGWWLGVWSVVDVYLNWAVATAARGGFDLTPFPQLQSLSVRLMDRPAFRKTMLLEDGFRSKLP